ncbi:MAG: hypothetical protein AAF483_10710 [Planctomycetota bacterium]
MTTTWEIVDGSASFDWGKWSAKLDPTQPNAFMRLHENQGSGTWDVLRIGPPGSADHGIEECYVRNRDLICRFAQSEKDTFGYQLDWRALDSQALGTELSLELWLSVQTLHLESTPTLQVACEAAESSSWSIMLHSDLIDSKEADANAADSSSGPAGLVAESKDSTSTAIWLTEDTDQCHAKLIEPSDHTRAIDLFGHFMEKGVLRRGRMQLHVLSGKAEQENLKQLYRKFCDRPLPLTA